jgi:hypothetical protein
LHAEAVGNFNGYARGDSCDVLDIVDKWDRSAKGCGITPGTALDGGLSESGTTEQSERQRKEGAFYHGRHP